MENDYLLQQKMFEDGVLYSYAEMYGLIEPESIEARELQEREKMLKKEMCSTYEVFFALASKQVLRAQESSDDKGIKQQSAEVAKLNAYILELTKGVNKKLKSEVIKFKKRDKNGKQALNEYTLQIANYRVTIQGLLKRIKDLEDEIDRSEEKPAKGLNEKNTNMGKEKVAMQNKKQPWFKNIPTNKK